MPQNLNLPSAGQFRAHPDSVARRLSDDALKLAGERIEAASRRTVGRDQRPDDASTLVLREPAQILACPLDPSWRRWDMFGPSYRQIPAEATRRCTSSRRLRPLLHLGLVALDWEAAPDDARVGPMTSAESGDVEWRYEEGSPHHVHAETTIGGVLVHIDMVGATKFGPGRSFTEFRIFVAGRLAGRGGRCGCSLGIGGSDLPAVARLERRAVITVDAHGEGPVVEVWGV